MILGGRKMHFIGNYNHDFPRLAKQSGFFFQLHRGKVNWSEIECLNLDDITENQNFELLEQNLLNVINCNLERDYDLKILDQNFVKLFKVAQLGIDYLSYCELYLDRCVVLLQEQLVSIQKEFELLKSENEGKNSEPKKTKNKKKINNYQCEKCEKVFISDVYLKFHDKRRHGNLSTSESKEGTLKNLVDASQQTESKGTLSVSIQTLLDEKAATIQKSEEIRKIKKSHNKKIKRLERNLNDVKARLQKAEKSLQETREPNHNPASLSFPSSVHYHPLLQFVPPCFPAPRKIEEAIADYQKSFNSRYPVSDSIVQIDTKVSEGQKSPVPRNAILKECNARDAERNGEAAKIDLISNKENVDPQDTVNLIKPFPPPRKTKKKIQNILSSENLTTETFHDLSSSAHFVTNVDPFSNQSIDFTTVKGEAETNIHSDNPGDVNAEKKNSNESINIKEEKCEEEPKSIFKQVVGRSSPKFHKLSKSLKRPLTNLYDSVSSTGKNLMKIEKKLENAKSVLVNDLNNTLRELGIDPEWKGIPKKTMKQKLKDLTHRRKLLSKENPFYTSVRQSAEEKIFEKLKKNFFIRKTLPQNSWGQEMEKEIYPSDENLRFKTQESQNVGNRDSAILYDTDMDSWSKASEPEKCERKQASPYCATPKQQRISDSDTEEEDALKLSKKKFDIHMFQIKTENPENSQDKWKKDMKLNVTGKVSVNSDFKENFSNRFGEGFFKAIHVKNNYENNEISK